MNRLMLDLGCGRNKTEGCIGIDISGKTDADIISDINKGLPFRDNSCDVIHANHILEHVDDFKFVMKEIWRVLKPDGRLFVRVPHYSHPGAYSDYTHRRYFCTASFDYFGDNKFDYYADFSFRVLKKKLIYQNNYHRYRKVYPAYIAIRLWGWFVQKIADISPTDAERFIGFFGFKELLFELKAVK